MFPVCPQGGAATSEIVEVEEIQIYQHRRNGVMTNAKKTLNGCWSAAKHRAKIIKKGI